MLVAGSSKSERSNLIGATEAQSKLNAILDGFFED